VDPGDISIDDLLAAALRDETAVWPFPRTDADSIEQVGAAAIVHGVSGLLFERIDRLADWPRQLVVRLGDYARAQAMWEMRHRQLLLELIQALDEQAIPCLFMKGTALAYDLYAQPATRSRGDTDLLVGERDAKRAKNLLASLGYSGETLGGVTSDFALQQTWTRALPDGAHSLDLHWQVMNAPSLKDVLCFEDCNANSRPLPRLSPGARTMDRARLLVHACLHRAMQNNAPYFVGMDTYFEPDRLIWTYDIHLLAKALGEDDWSQLCSLARWMGVSRPCLEGLLAAHARLGTEIPQAAIEALEASASKDRQSSYFIRSHALSRAWQDVRSVVGLSAKLRYMLSRVVTTEPFLRATYPQLADRPLPFLYGRRLVDLVRGKARRSAP